MNSTETTLTAEETLAISSLTVRRRMMADCVGITKGARRQHYLDCITEIDGELAELAAIAARLQAKTDNADSMLAWLDAQVKEGR